jgi:hypothetical protein
MTTPIPHPPAPRTAALERRLQELDRRLQLLIPRKAGSDARLLEHLRTTFVTPPDRDRSDTPPGDTGGGTGEGAHIDISERNGIWVLTIDGVWRGDYRKRAQAEAAAVAEGPGDR